MSEYTRTTRECSVDQLRPELLRAVQDYFQEQKLGDLRSETLLCCETISTRKETGQLVSWLSGKPDTTIHTGMLLTSDRLIWVHHGDQSGTRLNAAKLEQIRARFYVAPLSKDTSLEIVGYIGDAKNRIRGYIGMGAEPAAQKFCEGVQQAIDKVNPPTKKGLFGWLRG
ncbi:MAG TPA: hypothetical protein VHP14_19610 [Anaerolineales bacterium]|nr:hypothetical protein [Anaerolineales bacterium]